MFRVVRGRVSPYMLYKDTENPDVRRIPASNQSPSHLKFRGKRSHDDLDTFSSFYKRSNTPYDLGSFSSFYKRRLFKRNAGQTPDDLDTFSSMFKKRNLGGFASFYKKNRMRRQIEENPELEGFSSLFKRNDDLHCCGVLSKSFITLSIMGKTSEHRRFFVSELPAKLVTLTVCTFHIRVYEFTWTNSAEFLLTENLQTL